MTTWSLSWVVGVIQAYRSVLSATGSFEMAGASRWLEAKAGVPDRRPSPAAAASRIFFMVYSSFALKLFAARLFENNLVDGPHAPCGQVGPGVHVGLPRPVQAGGVGVAGDAVVLRHDRGAGRVDLVDLIAVRVRIMA